MLTLSFFSESPIVGFKDGSRTAFSREFLDEIKRENVTGNFIFLIVMGLLMMKDTITI